MITLETLTTPLTVDECRASIYDTLASTGVDTTAWKPGAVVRTIISGVSIIGSALSGLIANIAAGGFISLASGDWLTLAAFNERNVTRIDATAATTSVTLVNSGGGIYSGGTGDLVVANAVTGKTFISVGSWSLGAMGTTSVPVIAQEPGSASTTFVDELTVLVTPLANVTSTNPTSAVGQDAETDPQLQARANEKLGALSPNGPHDAYTFVAKSAVRLDGSPIGVTRVSCYTSGNGSVQVYVATNSGAVPGTLGDLSTDLGAVDDAMQRQATPLGVELDTATASAHPIDVIAQIWVYNTSGLTSAQLVTAIQTAITNYFTTVPIGGNVIVGLGAVYQSALEAVIGQAKTPNGVPLPIVRVVMTTPTGDTSLFNNEIPTAGDLSGITVTQIAPVP